MIYSEFVTLFPEPLAPEFHRTSPGHWIRQIGDTLNAVWIQKHSSGLSCCVNLGVHYSFVPKVGTGELASNGTIEQAECEIKFRLTSNDQVCDQWWPISPTAVSQIVDLFVRRGLPTLNSYGLHEGILKIVPSDIEQGNATLLTNLTRVRACLLLARLHDHMGNRQKCAEAASAGLRHAGKAVGPKVALQRLLKKCEE
jgi:hypothetical protein